MIQRKIASLPEDGGSWHTCTDTQAQQNPSKVGQAQLAQGVTVEEVEWGRGQVGGVNPWVDWPRKGGGARIWHFSQILTLISNLVGPDPDCSDLCHQFW